MSFNKDQLNHVSTLQTTHAMYQLIDHLQEYNKGVQLLAPALIVLKLAEAYQTDPVDIMAVARNFLDNHTNRQDERVKALDYYIKNYLQK